MIEYWIKTALSFHIAKDASGCPFGRLYSRSGPDHAELERTLPTSVSSGYVKMVVSEKAN